VPGARRCALLAASEATPAHAAAGSARATTRPSAARLTRRRPRRRAAAAGVLVVGAGIAGWLPRTLLQGGLDDVHVFELEDAAGGNSRGTRMAGMAARSGALPAVPGEQAREVSGLLANLGLRRTEHGRAVYDERHLCHSPRRRHSHRRPLARGPAAHRPRGCAGRRARCDGSDHTSVSPNVSRRWDAATFAIPTARAACAAELDTLTGRPFAQWLPRRPGRTALRGTSILLPRDYGAGAHEAGLGQACITSRAATAPPPAATAASANAC
jgi:hypothetical protein